MKIALICMFGLVCIIGLVFLITERASNRYDSIYEDKYYSEGSIMTQEGVKMKAKRGQWIPVSDQNDAALMSG